LIADITTCERQLFSLQTHDLTDCKGSVAGIACPHRDPQRPGTARRASHGSRHLCMRWLRTALVAVGRRVRPSREFAPAGDLLFCFAKKVGKKGDPGAWPLRGALRTKSLASDLSFGRRQTSHLACLRSCLSASTSLGRAQLTSLRSVQTRGAKSVHEVASRRPRNFPLLTQAQRDFNTVTPRSASA
jgi:hypothetical protein